MTPLKTKKSCQVHLIKIPLIYMAFFMISHMYVIDLVSQQYQLKGNMNMNVTFINKRLCVNYCPAPFTRLLFKVDVSSGYVVDITTWDVTCHHDHPAISTGLWKYLLFIDTCLKPALTTTNVLWNCFGCTTFTCLTLRGLQCKLVCSNYVQSVLHTLQS